MVENIAAVVDIILMSSCLTFKQLYFLLAH